MDIGQIYGDIWLWSTFAFCLMIFVKYVNSSKCTLLQKNTVSSAVTILYCVAFAIWIGLRPMDLSGWADSANYARVYLYQVAMAARGVSFGLIVDTDTEWLWGFIMNSFAAAQAPVNDWFLFIAFCYIGFMYLGIRRMMPCNQWIALLFCIGSLSFFTYSFNGLRNGMACSIIIFAMSFYVQFNKKGLIIGLLLSFLALGIHRSTALPTVCMLFCYFTKAGFKWSFAFWCLSIIISLVAGREVQQLIVNNLGFDDRLQGYAGQVVSDIKGADKIFRHTGFRWDMLLYGAMPIFFGYYIVYKKMIRDRAYNFIIATYILANSFWVMVIQATYSNRFAYLSWFMYPIVFAYPLLKIHIWKDQDRKTAQILMLYIIFTILYIVLLYR